MDRLVQIVDRMLSVETAKVGEMPPERRRVLFAIATREFARAGYRQASLNKVIRACSMSKSSFYHYFDSKLALFDAVVVDGAAELKRALAAPEPHQLAGPGFWDDVGELANRLLELLQRRDRYAEFGAIFYLDDAPATSGALRGVVDRATAWLNAALQAGRDCHAVRNDLPTSLQAALVLSVLRAMDSWSVAHLGEVCEEEGERLLGAQLDALRRLLAPDGLQPHARMKT